MSGLVVCGCCSGCGQLLEKDFDLTEEDILWLDSSSERKFSVHLVVPKLVFSSNQVVKIFLETLCHSLSQEHQERFTFNEKLMVDTKCYSRNQNFRILHSTKFGKNSHLRVGDHNKFPFTSGAELFEASLVSSREREVTVTLVQPGGSFRGQARISSRRRPEEREEESRTDIPSGLVEKLKSKIDQLTRQEIGETLRIRTLIPYSDSGCLIISLYNYRVGLI